MRGKTEASNGESLCPCAGYHAYQRTLETVPARWWEYLRARLVVAAVLLPVLFWMQRSTGVPPENRLLSALGMLAFAIGWIGDTYTTNRVMKLKPAFDRRGVAFPIPEQNRFLPQYPTLREQLLSWVSVFSVVYLALAFYTPMVASVCALLVQGGQTVTNVRIGKRVKLALAYLDAAGERYHAHHAALI